MRLWFFFRFVFVFECININVVFEGDSREVMRIEILYYIGFSIKML